jgi:hypothetical protein
MQQCSTGLHCLLLLCLQFARRNFVRSRIGLALPSLMATGAGIGEGVRVHQCESLHILTHMLTVYSRCLRILRRRSGASERADERCRVSAAWRWNHLEVSCSAAFPSLQTDCLSLSPHSLLHETQFWLQTLSSGSAQTRMTFAASRSVPPMVVASLSVLAACMIGTWTTLPGLRSFCIYVGVGVLLAAAFQALLFGPAVALDAKRQDAQRSVPDLLCLLVYES